MSFQKRKSNDRGHADHGWLKSYHTFSFADYFDRNHHHFRDLRVINEDYVQGGMGFPMHSHQDFEIVSYVISGSMEHKDSLGNTAIIRPDEVQRMSAGTGVTHSEFNPSDSETLHLLQIWLQTEKKGIAPSYEQKTFSREAKRNRLCLIVSREGKENSVSIHQNVNIYDSVLDAGKHLDFKISEGRHAWIQMISGALQVDGETLEAGDGLAVSEEVSLTLKAEKQSNFLLFDLS